MTQSSIILLLVLFVLNGINCECPAKDHPLDLVKCIDLNPKMIGDLFKSPAREAELATFCRAINSYLSCMKSYLAGCIGEKLAKGGIEEIMDLNKKCCIDSDKSSCILTNINLINSECFANDNTVIMANNQTKFIGDVKVGDVLKSVDSSNKIVDSNVIAILHRDHTTLTKFLKITTYNGTSISLTPKHLIFTKEKGFIKANKLKTNDIIKTVYSNNNLIEHKIANIKIELKRGFIAPLTDTGTLLVNQIHSSCYAEINSHYLAHFVMKPINIWYKIKNYFISFQEESNGISEKSFILNQYASLLHYISLKLFPSLFN